MGTESAWRRSRLTKAWFAVALAISGCQSGDTQLGPGEFESAGSAGGNGRSTDDDFNEAPSAGEDESGGDAPERTVEEADIYRFEGDRLYVLNQFRGLYVFDVSDKSHPVQIGRLPIKGQPIEMYVRDGRAYAIVSDYFDWAYDEFEGLTPHYGSRIIGIDLTDPENPVEIGSTFLDGHVSDTRLVGDIIYAAANRWAWYSGGGSESSESRDLIAVTSIDISNPRSMREVQQLTLEGSGWYVQASPTAFVVAGSNWSSGEQTRLVYIDISSPTGEMAKTADLNVPGYVQDDTAINLYGNQLRLLTRTWNTQTTTLRIFDTTTPTELTQLGHLDYTYEGNVYGTTYDGDRLYMIHYQTIDPLEVVDLSDPTHPYIAGILEMPGWVDRIAALGDRLIGLGYDDTDARQVSLTLFDVSDAAHPALLDRVNSGEGWAWTAASWERKAWTVDAESGVVLFPYASYGRDWNDTHFALGIVDFTRDDLSPRGEVEATAPVERGAIRDGRVFALSQATLQVVDIRDHVAPVSTATIELARNVLGYGRTSSVGVELVTPGLGWYYWSGRTTDAPVLRATDRSTPDADAELGRVSLPRAANQIFAYGDLIIATTTNNNYYGYGVAEDAGGSGETSINTTPGITVVSFADPTHPAVIADLDLPAEGPTTRSDAYRYETWQGSYDRAFGAYQGGKPALDLGDGRFAFIRTTSLYCSSREGCASLGIEPEIKTYEGGGSSEPGSPGMEPAPRDVPADSPSYEYVSGNRQDNALVVLDLNPTTPTLGATQALPTGYLAQMFSKTDALFFTRAEPSRTDSHGYTYVRNYLHRYTVDAAGALEANERVNIPGVAISLNDDGDELIALDSEWEELEGGNIALHHRVHGVRIDGSVAAIASSVDLGTGYGNPSIARSGDALYVLKNAYNGYYYGGDVAVDVATPRSAALTILPVSSLLTIDARDIDSLTSASNLNLGLNTSWSIYAQSDSTLALYGGYYRNGLALVNVTNALAPTYRRFQTTQQGWSSAITQDGSHLFLVNGPYGIESINIDE